MGREDKKADRGAFNSFLIKILVIVFSVPAMFPKEKGFQFFFNQDFGHLSLKKELLINNYRKYFQFFFNQDFGHLTVFYDVGERRWSFQFFFNQDFGHRVRVLLDERQRTRAFNSFLIKILVIAAHIYLSERDVANFQFFFNQDFGHRFYEPMILHALRNGFQFFFNQDFGHPAVQRRIHAS